MARDNIPGILRRDASGRLVLSGLSRKGRPVEVVVEADDIIPDVLRLAERAPVNVVYDTRGGRPVGVRPAGEDSIAVSAAVTAEAPAPPPPGKFHHPYSFIPVSPGRRERDELPEPARELADREPT